MPRKGDSVSGFYSSHKVFYTEYPFEVGLVNYYFGNSFVSMKIVKSYNTNLVVYFNLIFVSLKSSLGVGENNQKLEDNLLYRRLPKTVE